MSSTFRAAIVPVTPYQQNCTLLWDDESKRGAIVDPGGDVDRILATVRQIGMQVEKILLTHGHLDHAGGAEELRDKLLERTGAANLIRSVPIEGPDQRDRFLLDNLEEENGRPGFANLRNVTPDRWLVEGDRVEIAGLPFDVLHCPGHTPGHVVFVQRELRFAQVGDVLFQGSVGRTDFPYGDGAALIQAIKTKLLPLGDDIAFICGHGPQSTIGAERLNNPFLR